MSSENTFCIEVKSLIKKYEDITAVDGISFKVKKKEIFAFLGPNGAGKTTTVEILECLRDPTSGEAKVLGLDIRKNQKEIKKRIGVLPQQFNTFERLTVRESIQYFANLYSGKKLDADYLMELVDLKDKARILYRNLSGGLMQRVGLAIALVNDPELIFLDEPTAGLDPKARHRIWNVIKGLKEKGKTVFITTHYMEEAQFLADTVMIINKGKIVAEGTPDELISKYGHENILVVRKGGKKALASIDGIVTGGKLGNNSDVEVPLKSKSDLMEVIEALDKHKVDFEEIVLKRPTLEDVFLNLTGEKLIVEEEQK